MTFVRFLASPVLSQQKIKEDAYILYAPNVGDKILLENGAIKFTFGDSWTDSNTFIYTPDRHKIDTLDYKCERKINIITIDELLNRGLTIYQTHAKEFEAKHGVKPPPPINKPYQFFKIYILEKKKSMTIKYPVEWQDVIP